MTTLKAYGRLLTAATDDRKLTYRLLPFGEVGRTNRGKITASKGTLTILPDPVVANLEHDPTKPVAWLAATETDDGLDAVVDVARTTTGDDLLAEAAAGLRTGISVEIEDPVIREGQLLGGTLTGAGFVTTPAFPSAQLVAADAGELPADAVTQATELLSQALEVITSNTAPGDEPEDDPTAAESAESENTMGASLTAAAAATAGVQSPHGTTTEDKTADQVFRMLAGAFKSGSTPKMLAALADVVHDDGDADGDGLGEITAAPGWLGEVYAKAAYQRKYIPLITQGSLTSYREKGFRFSTLPTVAKYNGNKAEVPTGGMTAVEVDYLVQRWAHAADLDRRFIDFGDSDVLRAFVEAQVESYKKVTDVETLVNIIAAATAYTPGTVPTGINTTLAAIVDGALELIADDFTPTFALVGSGLYRDILLTPKDDVTEYLSSAFGLEDGTVGNFRIVPSGHANAVNQVVVGDGSTLRFKELGGGTPVRVEAEHVANGGRDLAVFGYTSFQELVPDGAVIADLTPAG